MRRFLVSLLLASALVESASVTGQTTRSQTPPGPCSPGGVCDHLTQRRKAQGGGESQCAAQRLACWEYWRCA
jgi:hypothetical protein